MFNKEDDIIALYKDHATSEQFHSEFKTDLERLPSGQFASNALLMSLKGLAGAGFTRTPYLQAPSHKNSNAGAD